MSLTHGSSSPRSWRTTSAFAPAATLASVAQPGAGSGVHSEDDESAETNDNSLGRLLTISDGVFAIAMTLLTLDLKVPDLGRHPSDAALRHTLFHNSAS